MSGLLEPKQRMHWCKWELQRCLSQESCASYRNDEKKKKSDWLRDCRHRRKTLYFSNINLISICIRRLFCFVLFSLNFSNFVRYLLLLTTCLCVPKLIVRCTIGVILKIEIKPFLYQYSNSGAIWDQWAIRERKHVHKLDFSFQLFFRSFYVCYIFFF